MPLVQEGEELIILDQHGALERILYERLLKNPGAAPVALPSSAVVRLEVRRRSRPQKLGSVHEYPPCRMTRWSASASSLADLARLHGEPGEPNGQRTARPEADVQAYSVSNRRDASW